MQIIELVWQAKRIIQEVKDMDDHVYESVLSYAECELLPRFREEYKECEIIKECASYEEIKDLCTALNAMAKWAGYDRVTPSNFLV